MKSIEEFDKILKSDKQIEELEGQLEQMVQKFTEASDGKLIITENDFSLIASQCREIKSKLEYLKAYKQLKGWN